MTAAGPDPTRWHRVADPDALAQAASTWIAEAATAAITAHGRFHIVLAGGDTPRAAYRRMRTIDMEWPRWHVWFGDERCLPAGAAERNSRMARHEWLDHVPIPAGQVHPIPAERGPLHGAHAYAERLRGIDTFDLVLLGIGADGHTASLFPGSDWGTAPDAPAVLAVHDAPKPPPQRVSLSATRLARAHAVLFLVDGRSKHDAVQGWRRGDAIPARAIRPACGVDVLIVETGNPFEIAAQGGANMRIEHDREARMFFVAIDGQRSQLDYELAGNTMTITHTRVPESLGGRGIAGQLAQTALDAARAQGWKVVPACSYVRAWMERHPDYADLEA